MKMNFLSSLVKKVLFQPAEPAEHVPLSTTHTPSKRVFDEGFRTHEFSARDDPG